MKPALQAAGHPGCSQGEGIFLKPTTQQEVDFYTQKNATPTDLNEFLPTFMGTLNESSTNSQLLVLEDLCAPFKEPNILDVKLGYILFDSNASEEKQARLKEVSAQTTSGSLGFRIAGMTVFQHERVYYDKMFGREATKENVVEKLAKFFVDLNNEFVLAVLEGIINRLEELHDVLSTEFLEMRSVSVLIIYEGDLVELEKKVLNGDQVVDLRLIDFAHTKTANSADVGVLAGLANLKLELLKLHN